VSATETEGLIMWASYFSKTSDFVFCEERFETDLGFWGSVLPSLLLQRRENTFDSFDRDLTVAAAHNFGPTFLPIFF